MTANTQVSTNDKFSPEVWFAEVGEIEGRPLSELCTMEDIYNNFRGLTSDELVHDVIWPVLYEKYEKMTVAQLQDVYKTVTGGNDASSKEILLWAINEAETDVLKDNSIEYLIGLISELINVSE